MVVGAISPAQADLEYLKEENGSQETYRRQRRFPVQKHQLSFRTPFIKKGSRRTFGHGSSNTTGWGSDDVELDRTPDKTSRPSHTRDRSLVPNSGLARISSLRKRSIQFANKP